LLDADNQPIVLPYRCISMSYQSVTAASTKAHSLCVWHDLPAALHSVTEQTIHAAMLWHLWLKLFAPFVNVLSYLHVWDAMRGHRANFNSYWSDIWSVGSVKNIEVLPSCLEHMILQALHRHWLLLF